MLIYNVTTLIETGRASEWVEWMREVHIPEVMATGFFTNHLMVRLLEVDETEGVTFAVQYHCTDRRDYDRYLNGPAPGLRESAIERWGEAAVSFRTLLEVIN